MSDQKKWRHPQIVTGLGVLFAAGMISACSSDETSDAGPDAGFVDTGVPDSGAGFVQPANTVPLNFTIDDSANKTYTAGELRWKGSFQYNRDTRLLTFDASWANGDSSKYPLVYDDGPWTTGGHEPVGATAGDKKWGVTAFFAKPAADQNFEYGAEDNSGWIWRGANGTFTVPAGSTAAVTATGLTVLPFGTIDLKLTIDTSTLAAGVTYTAGDTLKVKGSAWSWGEVDLRQVGATPVFEFILGENVGAGTDHPHSGKLTTGDKPEFVFVIHGVEYKSGGKAAMTGVKAYTMKPPATTWTETTVTRYDQQGGNGNTYVTAP